jgi:hypothetical protein
MYVAEKGDCFIHLYIVQYEFVRSLYRYLGAT